jgi:DnaJ-domain-containing protein 1
MPTNATMRQALGQQLHNVPDVRYASVGREHNLVFQHHSADIVVQTWMGARFYVYVLDSEPKLRDLRNTLRENTRHGIGTLFFVDACLLPEHEQQLQKLADWQQALVELNDGWIYAYNADGGSATDVSVTQVHFTLRASGRTYAIWHLCDFKIENAAVRIREVSESLRGRFAVADIASQAYKRHIDHERRNQRFHYSSKQTHQQQHGAGPPATFEAVKQHYDLLQVKPGASQGDVKTAYRRLAMRFHPDVSALPRIESERRFKQLNEAYEAIKRHNGWS